MTRVQISDSGVSGSPPGSRKACNMYSPKRLHASGASGWASLTSPPPLAKSGMCRSVWSKSGDSLPLGRENVRCPVWRKDYLTEGQIGGLLLQDEHHVVPECLPRFGAGLLGGPLRTVRYQALTPEQEHDRLMLSAWMRAPQHS